MDRVRLLYIPTYTSTSVSTAADVLHISFDRRIRLTSTDFRRKDVLSANYHGRWFPQFFPYNLYPSIGIYVYHLDPLCFAHPLSTEPVRHTKRHKNLFISNIHYTTAAATILYNGFSRQWLYHAFVFLIDCDNNVTTTTDEQLQPAIPEGFIRHCRRRNDFVLFLFWNAVQRMSRTEKRTVAGSPVVWIQWHRHRRRRRHRFPTRPGSSAWPCNTSARSAVHSHALTP